MGATASEFQSGVFSNWTVEVWMSTTNTYTNFNPAVVTQKYPSTINYVLGAGGSSSGTNISAGFYNGTWYTTSTGYTLPTNTWAQVTGTYDGANLKLYINGGLQVSTATTATATWANDGGIFLMKRWDNPDYFGGSLAIVRIYSRALSVGEINRNFNAQRARFSI